MNTWWIAFSAASRADLDQAISTLQEAQIGAANCSIDRLSIFIRRGVLSPKAENNT